MNTNFDRRMLHRYIITTHLFIINEALSIVLLDHDLVVMEHNLLAQVSILLMASNRNCLRSLRTVKQSNRAAICK